MMHILKWMAEGIGVWAEIWELCLYVAAVWLVLHISQWWL